MAFSCLERSSIDGNHNFPVLPVSKWKVFRQAEKHTEIKLWFRTEYSYHSDGQERELIPSSMNSDQSETFQNVCVASVCICVSMLHSQQIHLHCTRRLVIGKYFDCSGIANVITVLCPEANSPQSWLSESANSPSNDPSLSCGDLSQHEGWPVRCSSYSHTLVHKKVI